MLIVLASQCCGFMGANGGTFKRLMCRVLIIGAGAAGLECARVLSQLDDIEVQLVEAKGTVGGRVHSETVNGCTIDMGGEFFHGSNTLLTRFAEKHGIPMKRYFTWAHGDGGPSGA